MQLTAECFGGETIQPDDQVVIHFRDLFSIGGNSTPREFVIVRMAGKSVLSGGKHTFNITLDQRTVIYLLGLTTC